MVDRKRTSHYNSDILRVIAFHGTSHQIEMQWSLREELLQKKEEVEDVFLYMYLMTLDRAMEQEVQIDEERKWVHLKTGTHLEDGRKSHVLSESALRSSLFIPQPCVFYSSSSLSAWASEEPRSVSIAFWVLKTGCSYPNVVDGGMVVVTCLQK